VSNLNYNQTFIGIPNDLRNNRGKGIKVAILDSGINLDHVAFKESRIECVNNVNISSGIKDETGHGSHMAGIIAAKTEDLTGIAPDVELFISKVTSDGKGNYLKNSVINGLKWAIDKQVDVINLSFFISRISDDKQIIDLLNKANEANIIVVAAAGENSILEESSGGFYYPAMFDQCISVGGISSEFQKYKANAIFSKHLDFIMPMKEIVSCGNFKNLYIEKEGSSMSTAFVSGLICLIKANAKNPKSLGLKSVKELLNGMAQVIESNTDLEQKLTLLKG
jgi:major intracellular serine protease